MITPALQMLVERLLWPVPRIRWEAGRSLASLIREGNAEAEEVLLTWIQSRALESEVVLGLGIIDAFDLGSFFEFEEVSATVTAPSILSDWILHKNFRGTGGFSPFRYAASRPEPAPLPQYQRAWFNRFRKSAVAPMFWITLAELEQQHYFPLLGHWEHEWRWLQSVHQRPPLSDPAFFFRGNLRSVGQLHHGQREIFASAYLRTLAYAANIGAIPFEVTADSALVALTMNRGLADLLPIERPDWTTGLLSRNLGDSKVVAQGLLSCAESATQPGEMPISLRAIDVGREGFVEFDCRMVIGHSGFTRKPADSRTLPEMLVDDHPGEMAGLVNPDARSVDLRSSALPFPLSRSFMPKYPGSVHVELSLNIELASPHVLGTWAMVECEPSEIRLTVGDDVLSRWVHWYTDWEPASFEDLNSYIGSLCTVAKTKVDELLRRPDLETVWLAQVRTAKRPKAYLKPKTHTETFWM